MYLANAKAVANLANSAAVSYTHLDVYKRQTLSNGSSWQDANMMLRRDSTLSVC